jgi:hypothetical protein
MQGRNLNGRWNSGFSSDYHETGYQSLRIPQSVKYVDPRLLTKMILETLLCQILSKAPASEVLPGTIQVEKNLNPGLLLPTGKVQDPAAEHPVGGAGLPEDLW